MSSYSSSVVKPKQNLTQLTQTSKPEEMQGLFFLKAQLHCHCKNSENSFYKNQIQAVSSKIKKLKRKIEKN